VRSPPLLGFSSFGARINFTFFPNIDPEPSELPMKPPLFPSFLVLVLAAGLAATPLTLRADTSSPMFGGYSFDANGDTYTWDYAEEDGTWHYDYYNGSYGAVTVTGMIGFPNLAIVSGSLDGHLTLGTYGNNYEESGTPGDGSWETWQYTPIWTHHPDGNSGDSMRPIRDRDQGKQGMNPWH